MYASLSQLQLLLFFRVREGFSNQFYIVYFNSS